MPFSIHRQSRQRREKVSKTRKAEEEKSKGSDQRIAEVEEDPFGLEALMWKHCKKVKINKVKMDTTGHFLLKLPALGNSTRSLLG